MRSEAWHFELPGCLVREKEGSMAAERSAIQCMPVESRANGPIRVLVCRRYACWLLGWKVPLGSQTQKMPSPLVKDPVSATIAESQALAPSAETASRGCSASLVIVFTDEDRKPRTKSD